MDVQWDGIAIYQFDDSELHIPKPKTPEQALAMTQEYFEEWIPSAADILDFFKFAIEKRNFKRGAFQLNRATDTSIITFCWCALSIRRCHSHSVLKLRTRFA